MAPGTCSFYGIGWTALDVGVFVNDSGTLPRTSVLLSPQRRKRQSRDNATLMTFLSQL